MVYLAARYEVSQINSKLNGLLKEIGKKKKVGALISAFQETTLTDLRDHLEQGGRNQSSGGEGKVRESAERGRECCLAEGGS